MSLFEATRRHALALTAIPSVNGTAGEVEAVQYLHDHLRRHPAQRDGRMLLHLVPCPGDALGRQVLVAHLRGASQRGVMLLGHVDTVGTYDYGALEPLAFDPLALTDRVAAGALGQPAAARARSGNWLFGRGLLDMKAGVAAALAAFEAFAAEPAQGHLLFVATPDEEVGSLGVLALGPWLTEYVQSEGIRIEAVINTDYTAGRPSDAGARPIYLGSIGKLLAGVYVRGRPSHVGEPEFGLDPSAVVAAVTSRVVYGKDLVDQDEDEVTPVPVSLYQRDDKPFYDVQTALSACAYFNVFHMRRRPSEQLERFLALTREAVEDVRRRYSGFADPPEVPVYTAQQLWEMAPPALKADVSRHASNRAIDPREQSRRIVADLAESSVGEAPLVAVYFATGLIPAVRSGEDVRQAVHEAAEERAEASGERFALHRYFPYISDLSFLGPSPDWQDEAFPKNHPPTFVAPQRAPRLFQTATVMAGTYGIGAHRPDESIEVGYTFGELPLLLGTLVRRLWAGSA